MRRRGNHAMSPAAAFAALSIVLVIGLVVALVHIQRRRSERRQRGLFRSWGVTRVAVEAIDARFALGPLGPGRDAEIVFVPGWQTPGGISDFETWILCRLAHDARRIFEFGTGTGKTTYLLARNAPGALIVTLTIAPDAALAVAPGDATEDVEAARAEAFSGFYYEGAACAGRIEQLIGDSMTFDETPYLDSCDLVFVDGGHARSHVENDTKKALRMVKPGGWVAWHDYRGPRRARGVFETLNALAKTLPLRHIAGTALVVWQRPAA